MECFGFDTTAPNSSCIVCTQRATSIVRRSSRRTISLRHGSALHRQWRPVFHDPLTSQLLADGSSIFVCCWFERVRAERTYPTSRPIDVTSVTDRDSCRRLVFVEQPPRRPARHFLMKQEPFLHALIRVSQEVTGLYTYVNMRVFLKNDFGHLRRTPNSLLQSPAHGPQNLVGHRATLTL